MKLQPRKGTTPYVIRGPYASEVYEEQESHLKPLTRKERIIIWLLLIGSVSLAAWALVATARLFIAG